MDTTGDRLRQLITEQAVSIKDFCLKNKLNYSGISNIINGERELGMNVLRQLKNVVPNMDIDWLLFGAERKKLVSNQDLRLLAENDKLRIYENGDDDYLLEYRETDCLPNTTKEPDFKIEKPDLFEEIFLKYLDRPSVQQKLKDILNK